ncbi:hypothetical protein [Bacteroides sp.]|uniref:hypothetical protein n=1 Tax=Bacteroides sp. TaxID=29523 RepID=UPI0025B92705|nr:hypothetical protein [Bacteroides sp.]
MRNKVLSMNMKVCVLLLFIVMTNLCWFYKYDTDKKVIDALMKSVEASFLQNAELRMHKENRLYELEYNGDFLSDSLLLTDVNGLKVKLRDVINENKLILRYSELNCQTCVDEQINNLNTYADSIGVDRILLFTNYETDVYMRRFKKLNKIKFAIYNMKTDANKLLKDIGLPYMFVLSPNKKMRVQYMYIPQKEIPLLTSSYLKMVKDKFF